MNPLQNISLSDFSTMRLGGAASYLVEIHSEHELAEAIAWADTQDIPAMMIGTGSNIIWRDEGYQGLVMVNRIKRFESFEEDEANAYITIGAGENWDSVVERTVEMGLTGIEALSLIPGTAGATPIQNVGAYGQEISSTLVSVEAYDSQSKSFVNIPAIDCQFGYRSSRFKTTDHGRFYITAITLHLMRSNPEPPFYSTLQTYLEAQNITLYTPSVIRAAVIAIRSSKLPDPAVVANTGSFFANPIIDSANFADLENDYPNIPHWDTADDKVKISAAWLVEQVGFKDFHDQKTGMATWPAQALVFVNEHAKATADLLAFKQKVVETVQEKFGITLHQEPELLP